MTTVRISERDRRADGAFVVRVAFGADAEHELVVTDPADAVQEQELAWYFEEHLRFPLLDRDRERAVVAQLAEYGRALFAQVFGGVAEHDYRRLRDEAFDGCRVEVSGSAALHRLHWEALRDPHRDAVLALRMPLSRRVALTGLGFAMPPPRASARQAWSAGLIRPRENPAAATNRRTQVANQRRGLGGLLQCPWPYGLGPAR